MPRYHQVCCLESLALETLGRYVHSFGRHIMTSPSYEFEDVLNYFGTTLKYEIPPKLANDITQSLLAHTDGLCTDVCYTETDPSCRKMSALISAIIHPSLTNLNCTGYSSFLSSLVCGRLWTLNKMKVLKLNVMNYNEEECIISGLTVMVDLESFVFEFNCTDSIVRQLADTCRSLKSINICGSEQVTDESVQYLLHFPHLQEINTLGTSLSNAGYMELISGIVGRNIKQIGCNVVSDHHLDILIRQFSEVETLKLGLGQCDVRKVNLFSNLRHLSLYCVQFCEIFLLLSIIGSRIIELHLHNCRAIDIIFIGTVCCALKTFEIHSCSYSMKSHTTLRTQSSDFVNLEQLTVDKSSKYAANFNVDRLVLIYILTNCSKIRVIYVESYAEFDEDFVLSILDNNSLSELEELSIHATYSATLPLSCIRLLLTRCENLLKVDISGGTRPNDNVEEFVAEIRRDFPGAKLNVETRADVTL